MFLFLWEITLALMQQNQNILFLMVTTLSMVVMATTPYLVMGVMTSLMVVMVMTL